MKAHDFFVFGFNKDYSEILIQKSGAEQGFESKYICQRGDYLRVMARPIEIKKIQGEINISMNDLQMIHDGLIAPISTEDRKKVII